MIDNDEMENKQIAEQNEAQNAEEIIESASNEKDEVKESSLAEDNQTEGIDIELEEEIEVDYETFSKSELHDALKELSNDDQGFLKATKISSIQSQFNTLREEEKKQAKQKFVAEGGEEDDFEFRFDDTSKSFNTYSKILREKKHRHYKELESQKENNLKKKEDLLDRLRSFVKEDENAESLQEIKNYQSEWKAIGQVPNQDHRRLWSNYNALMDMFYGRRSIHFELKDLDRKKNLEAKEELCKKAESLIDNENIGETLKKLNSLHDEWKHIGVVPMEQKDAIWDRFKAASDAIYAKRKEHFAQLQLVFEENLKLKKVLLEKITEFASFETDKIDEWKQKNEELTGIQKEWEAIGSVPKENAKEVNKAFWAAFKSFYQNKSVFFKSLDSKREENVLLKEQLIEQALELKDSQDWRNTTEALKSLQNKWKEIGPVPDKKREKVYKKFKSACDEFFNKRRDHEKVLESEFEGNLVKKEDVCSRIEAQIGTESLDPETIYELQDEFNSIGFVPKNNIKSLQKRYDKALKDVVSSAKHLDEDALSEFRSLLSINQLKSSPNGDQKLVRKEHTLRKKIQDIEGDVATWKNNISFFSVSSNASALLKDYEQKIIDGESELKRYKEELRHVLVAE